MDIHSTKSITPGIRKRIPNGFRHFDICECCGYNYLTAADNWKGVVFRTRFNMAICDECTDKKDGTWVYPQRRVMR